jgi:hypothetical protein
MATSIPEAVRAWLATLTSADPTETPEEVGQGEDPTNEPDAGVAAAEVAAAAAAEGVDPAAAVETEAEVNPAAAAAETEAEVDPAAAVAAPEGDPAPAADPAREERTETLPEPDTGLSDDDRDGMNALAVENEALRQENRDLRTRIAQLGGDEALGIVEEVVEAPVDEPVEEYDAEADIAEQQAELARLRGQ